MNYFLAKSEPTTYSIQDLEQDKQTLWDGVHNFQAINYIKTWQIDDMILIYHSGGVRKIVGMARVISQPRLNPDDKRTSWVADIEFVSKFSDDKCISLDQIKQTGKFADWNLIRNSRLSVMDVPNDFVKEFLN
jgi:predicted RNA-binding protein with PUA-like domain